MGADRRHTAGATGAGGQNVIVYTTQRRVMYLQALQPRTGRTLWRKAASAGLIPDGMYLSPLVLGNRVIYLRPVGYPGDTRLVVADVTTGRDLSVSPAVYQVFDAPADCHRAVCFGATVKGTQIRFRLEPATGKVSATTPTGITDNGIEIVDDLYMVPGDPEKKQPDRLSGRSAGKQVWSRPLTDLFGTFASSRSYWLVHTWTPGKGSRIAAHGDVLIGTVGPEPPASTGTVAVNELIRTTGFGAKDGVGLWTVPGSSHHCVIGLNGLAASAFLRCRFSADALAAGGANGPVLVRGSVALEAFDPGTGKTRWSVPLKTAAGANVSTVGDAIRSAFDGRLVVPTRSGIAAVDVATGKARPSDGAAIVCRRDVEADIFGYRSPGSQYRRTIGYLDDSCNAAGQPVELPQMWPDWMSTETGGVRVVSTGRGIRASTMDPSLPTTRPATPGTDRSALLPTVNPEAKSGAPAKEQWAAHGFSPLSQPVAAGNLVLLYGSRGGDPTLEALDAATGRSVWSTEVARGQHGPAVGDVPAVAGTTVLFARPDGESNEIVVADAATGPESSGRATTR